VSLLDVTDLRVSFPTADGVVKAVRGVGTVEHNESLLTVVTVDSERISRLGRTILLSPLPGRLLHRFEAFGTLLNV